MEGNKPQPAWRRIVRIEAAGLRTAAAVIAPFLIGQQTGHLAEGLLIGLGALYVTIADKEGASGWTLLATTAGVGIAGLLGTIAGASLWLAVATMFLTAFCAGMAQTWGDPAFYSGFAVDDCACGYAGNVWRHSYGRSAADGVWRGRALGDIADACALALAAAKRRGR